MILWPWKAITGRMHGEIIAFIAEVFFPNHHSLGQAEILRQLRNPTGSVISWLPIPQWQLLFLLVITVICTQAVLSHHKAAVPFSQSFQSSAGSHAQGLPDPQYTAPAALQLSAHPHISAHRDAFSAFI